jgi:hypothetical protein
MVFLAAGGNQVLMVLWGPPEAILRDKLSFHPGEFV